MARTRLRPSTIALACLALMPLAVQSQVLKQRYPGHTDCPDTHLRLTARQSSGSPAAGLRPQDLYLWFSTGTADILSIESGTTMPDTNLLIVLRPGTAFAQSDAAAVMRNLRVAAKLHWKIAVLTPDGSISPFLAAADEASLQNAFSKIMTGSLSNADWPAAERNAFRQLHARSGRHVILELTQPAAGSSAGDPNAFAEDHTLDLLARDDMAQIYNLTAGTKEEFAATGGRGAPTIDALFQGIVADAPGSYDLTIHPQFSCQPGASYSLRITTFRPDVQLFYPSAIRMATAASR